LHQNADAAKRVHERIHLEPVQKSVAILKMRSPTWQKRTDRRRIVNQRRAIHATKLQRFISLNAITLGTNLSKKSPEGGYD
jgi:hypothetical protein